MRVSFSHIKVVVLLVLVGFLYAFASHRNSERKVTTPTVQFVGEDNLYVTQEAVSKLLIQNQESVTDKRKDIIDLNALETSLNSNPMIKEAQVFMSVSGSITAKVEQKKPIARVKTNASYYIDDTGSFMPLSKNYSARVPLVTGKVEKNNLQNLFIVAQKIKEDEFLKTHVVEIHQNEDESIDLRFREHDFIVHLGSLELLDKKINNLKAFYLQAMKDNSLEKYSVVNLKFDKQVICTKKEGHGKQ